MIRWLLPIASAALVAAPLHAQEEPAAAPPGASSFPVALAMAAMKHAAPQAEATRFVQTAPRRQFVATGRAQYGPFRVVANDRVEMIGATDRATPEQFAALLRDFPGVRRIDMVECPGTHDDRANLRLGRMIRAAGLATHVPRHGSVRSGAVDLFLAGRERAIENGARFAVHSWRDPQGREADDFAADAAPNLQYLAYYREMGMNPAAAQAFYAFTNSVPHDGARWLRAGEMRAWTASMGGAPARPLAEHRALAATGPASGTKAGTIILDFDAIKRMALLDVSMLDRTSLPGRHPALRALDSVRRL